MSGFGHNKRTKNRTSWNNRESVIKPETASRERVTLDPEAFDRLLEQHGIDIKVYRTLYCPQVKSVDGAEHNIDCTQCNGSGWIDVDPIKTRAFIQNQGLETLAQVEGFVQGNTVALTFPTGIEIQYFTKIELIDFTDIYIQRILRKVGSDIDVLKYRAKRVHVIIDSDMVRYYQDQDFKIDQNGNITWTGSARKPADNKIYSIHYETSVQYRAITAMHANRFIQAKAETGIEHLKMPEQWMCVKEYLVKRIDLEGNETPQGPYDSHTIVEDNS